jgi:hypothetical protein
LPPGTAGGGLDAGGVAAGLVVAEGCGVPALTPALPHAAVALATATKTAPKRVLLMTAILRHAG